MAVPQLLHHLCLLAAVSGMGGCCGLGNVVSIHFLVTVHCETYGLFLGGKGGGVGTVNSII